MARRRRIPGVWAVLLVLLVATIVPSIPLHDVRPSTDSALVPDSGGSGCGNSSNPCAVVFTETGLPGSPNWNVTINGTLEHSAGSNQITVNLPNGSYTFQVGAYAGYTPTPASGPAPVSGNTLTIAISWSLPNYSVTFQESGLPGSTSWTVDLNGNSQSSTSSTISFFESNGTYPYSILTSDTQYSPSPASSSVNVSGGSPPNVQIAFSLVEYSVTFTESGLPLGSGTTWTVTLGGATKHSQTTTIVFTEPNGTYAWNVTPVSGWHASRYSANASVNGTGVSISIVWALVTYNIWVNETGLPAGYNWAVTLNGVYRTANTSSIPYSQPNGTYLFTVQKLSGYLANTYSGQIVVSGGPVNQTILWTRVVYTLSFLESGLLTGALWNVSIGNQTVGSTLPIVAFSLPNGTYNYSVAGPAGFVPSPQSGHVSIYGSSRNVSIGFGPFVYMVSFNETGLSAGSTWSVAIDGVRFASNTSTLSAHEANGSYTYFVQKVRGYVFQPTGGTFQVSGQPLVLNITYTAVTYLVAFAATGLLANQNWSVTLGTTTEIALGNQAITFALANGTYAFRVNPLSLEIPLAGVAASCGHNITLPAGNLTVCGRNVLLTEGFLAVPGWPVTFLEQGLDVGVAWSVSIDGAVYFGSASSLVINITNGVYSFYLGYVPGYDAPVSSGIVHVANGSVAVNVTFVRLGGAQLGPPHGFSRVDWVLIGGVVAAGGIVAAALLIRRRRERSSAEEPAGATARGPSP